MLDREQELDAVAAQTASIVAELVGTPAWTTLRTGLAGALANGNPADEQRILGELDATASAFTESTSPEDFRASVETSWKIDIALTFGCFSGAQQGTALAALRDLVQRTRRADLGIPDGEDGPVTRETWVPEEPVATPGDGLPSVDTTAPPRAREAPHALRNGAANTVRDVNAPAIQVRDVTGGVHQAEHRYHFYSGPPTALSSLPPAPAVFTGRENDLGGVVRGLTPQEDSTNGAAQVLTITGMGGIGKTALALKAAHAVRDRGWFGSTVFLNMRGYDETSPPVRPTEALESLLRALGVHVDHIPPTQDEREGLYRSRLHALHEETGSPVLVVADNVASSDQVLPLVPGGHPHGLLVTSRDMLHTLSSKNFGLGVLSPEGGAELVESELRQFNSADSRVADQTAVAHEVVSLCGYLPLALQIAAALLKRAPDMCLGELAGALREALEEAKSRLGELDDGERAVRPAFDLSYDRLDPAEREMVRRLALNPGPDFSEQAAAVLVGQPEHTARRILRRLAAAHLIQWGAEESAGRWSFHDLARDYANERAWEDPMARSANAEAEKRLLDFYRDNAGEADAHLSSPSGHAELSRFGGLEDALEWLDAERGNLVGAVSRAAGAHPGTAARLALHLAEYLQVRRRNDEAVAVSTVALEIGANDGDRYVRAHALNNLGVALRQSRRFDEAVTYLDDAREMYHALGDRRSEAMAWNNLGNTLQGLRRFDEAIAAHEKAREMYHALGDRRSEAMAWNNLGNTLQELRRFDEAIAAHEKAQDTYRELGEQRSEATAATNLGNALRLSGRIEEAVVRFLFARDVYQALDDRPSAADALNNLGVALVQAHRAEEAVTPLTDARDTYLDLDEDHSEATASLNLGRARDLTGHTDAALRDLSHARARFRALGDRRGEAATWNSTGDALDRSEQYDQAAAAYTTARGIHHDLCAWRDEAETCLNLGSALQRAGKPGEAVAAYKRARDIYRDLGSRRSEALASAHLGDALQQDGRVDEAATVLNRARDLTHETTPRDEVGVSGGDDYLTTLIERVTARLDTIQARGRDMPTALYRVIRGDDAPPWRR